jgi:hypothetical protein
MSKKTREVNKFDDADIEANLEFVKAHLKAYGINDPAVLNLFDVIFEILKDNLELRQVCSKIPEFYWREETYKLRDITDCL